MEARNVLIFFIFIYLFFRTLYKYFLTEFKLPVSTEASDTWVCAGGYAGNNTYCHQRVFGHLIRRIASLLFGGVSANQSPIGAITTDQ